MEIKTEILEATENTLNENSVKVEGLEAEYSMSVSCSMCGAGCSGIVGD